MDNRFYYEDGVGLLCVDSRGVYDKKYFNKYVKYEKSELGKKLNEFRVGLCSGFSGDIVDVGIGSGQFVKAMNKTRACFGYDVNKTAVDWLQSEGLWLNVYDPIQMDRVSVITFFDSFEHIHDIKKLLYNLNNGTIMVVSIPIFKDLKDMVCSKHFRPDEHWWYFTERGLEKFLSNWKMLDKSDMETKLGRESIMTYIFKKRW